MLEKVETVMNVHCDLAKRSWGFLCQKFLVMWSVIAFRGIVDWWFTDKGRILGRNADNSLLWAIWMRNHMLFNNYYNDLYGFWGLYRTWPLFGVL